MAKKLYQVDEDFIRQAHEAACSQWKEKLEDKFPEVFEEHRVIQFIERKIGKLGGHIRMFVYGDYLAILLPNANTEWTFQVWDYVKKICAINTGAVYDCYPVHGPNYEEIIKKSPEWSADGNYQIVDIEAIKRML